MKWVRDCRVFKSRNVTSGQIVGPEVTSRDGADGLKCLHCTIRTSLLFGCSHHSGRSACKFYPSWTMVGSKQI